MRTVLVLVWMIASVGTATAKGLRLRPMHQKYTETKVDSAFFSVKSLCNFSVEFTSDKKVKATLNGKSYIGTTSANKFTKGFYDFTADSKVIFSFTMDSGKLLIANQQYQFGCESAKIIELSRLTSNANLTKDFDDYEKFNVNVWQNVSAVNDKAYYLGEMKFYEASAGILEKIVSKNPDRIVAWLNLGDSLWETKKFDRAKVAYQTYVQQMKKHKKDESKIPQRVHQRLKP